MSSVDFLEPTTVDEAVALMRANAHAHALGGGTDLVVHSRSRKAPLPATLINLGSIAELDRWTVDTDGTLHLGAMVSHATIETANDIRTGWPALSDASSIVGSPATRNVGTIGGNLCNGSPAMEIGAPLLVYGAAVTLASAAGTRSLELAAFMLGPGRTARKPDEILTQIVVPPAHNWDGSAYLRLGFRRAMEIAVVGAAAAVRLGRDGTVVDCALALTAVAPTVVRAVAAENELRGVDPTPEAIGRAAEATRAHASPIDDVRAPASYRLEMTPIITRRAIELAVERAQASARANSGGR
jgi:CO/xanthine dehydrogenase FAD-binding subunit